MFTKTSRSRFRCRFAQRLHRDEGGAISMLSVFAVILLTMLLGMVMNVGRHVDHKIKMQNAADAAAYSGGLAVARGMNTLTFTNHLLCDVFALTAFMREARDRNAEQLVPDVLAAWVQIGPVFSASGFRKFSDLGEAITKKVPREQKMVSTYGAWASASSELILPVLEEVLQKELIPEFQRALVATIPQTAQTATNEVARAHGLASSPRMELQGVLWRTTGEPVAELCDQMRHMLPVVDPAREAGLEGGSYDYMAAAVAQRRHHAHLYLAQWNHASLAVFDHEAKMSRFGSLWRSFTCGHLEKLLNDEYPYTNLPHVIRTLPEQMADVNAHVDGDYTFVSVVYGPHVKEVTPGLFRNPAHGDALAFAQVTVFIPRPRLVRGWRRLGEPPTPPPVPSGGVDYGGVPGDYVFLPAPPTPGTPPAGDVDWEWYVIRQNTPTYWDLLNQYWNVKLVPATTDRIATILQTPPPTASAGSGSAATPATTVTLPNLGGLSSWDLSQINTH